jgi:hypothetical protein
MGLASFLETFSIVCNCFCPPHENSNRKLAKQYADIDKQLAYLNGKYNIHILKVATDFHLKNLYPITDQVERWSVFIVGNDLTYIHVSVGDFTFPESKKLLNHQGTNIMNPELNEFFEPLWKQTLAGSQLQFYMSVAERLYFVNTYPFVNDNKYIIGAVMFIRPFTSEKAQSMNIEEYVKGRASSEDVKDLKKPSKGEEGGGAGESSKESTRRKTVDIKMP